MKTIAQIIAVTALATAGAVQATDTQPVTAAAATTPHGFQAPSQGQFEQIATQQRTFFEQQRAAMEQAMEAQRQHMEQQFAAQQAWFEQQQPFASTPVGFEAPARPSFPETPSFEAPSFEMPEFPATPDLSGLDSEARHSALRNHSEQVRAAIQAHREEQRASLQERREAAKQAHAKRLEQLGRTRPEV